MEVSVATTLSYFTLKYFWGVSRLFIGFPLAVIYQNVSIEYDPSDLMSHYAEHVFIWLVN